MICFVDVGCKSKQQSSWLVVASQHIRFQIVRTATRFRWYKKDKVLIKLRKFNTGHHI